MKHRAACSHGLRSCLLAAALMQACTGTIRDSQSGPEDQGLPETTGSGGTNTPTPQPPMVAPRVDPCQLTPRRLVSLTPAHLTATASKLVNGGLTPSLLDIREALAGVEGVSETLFSNDVDARDLSDDNYTAKLLELAERLGGIVFNKLSKDDSCLKSEPRPASCASDWIERAGRQAFRRPIGAEEKQEFIALFEAETGRAGAEAGVSAVVQSMFLSPLFLYRTEIGTGEGPQSKLTSHEIAQAISYWLTEGPPDAALSADADAGMLADPAAREAHVMRLLAKPTAKTLSSTIRLVPGLKSFFYQWLQIDPEPAKEERIYGARDDRYWGWMEQELDAFISDHLWNRGARWDDLLTDDAVYPNQGLVYSETYKTGIVSLPKYPDGICDSTFFARPESCIKDPKDLGRHPSTRIEGADKEGKQAGLLTSPLAMASQSLFDRTDAVLRGKWVRQTFLCQEIPAPPATVAAVPPPASPMLTARERFAAHSTDPSCAACHSLMDPIGYGLETYDAVGRYRTHELKPDLENKGLYFESGRAIDTRGSLADVTVEGHHGDHAFADASELAGLLAKSDEAQRCFVSVAHAFASNRYAHPADACRRDELQADFADSGFNILALFARIATRADFVTRGAP